MIVPTINVEHCSLASGLLYQTSIRLGMAFAIDGTRGILTSIRMDQPRLALVAHLYYALSVDLLSLPTPVWGR